MAASKESLEPQGLILPATVPTRVYKNRSATRAFKYHLTPVERTFDGNTVVKRAWSSQVVEQKSAPVELTLDKLAVPEGRAAKRTILERRVRRECRVERTPIPIHFAKIAAQQGSANHPSVDPKLRETAPVK